MNTKNKTQEKLHRCPSRAGLAQSIERLTSEREVVGSVPRAGLNSVLNKYVRGKYIDAPVKCFSIYNNNFVTSNEQIRICI